MFLNLFSSPDPTPLITAIKTGKTDQALALIKEGKGLTEIDSENRTPVHHAAIKGNETVFEALRDVVIKSPLKVTNLIDINFNSKDQHKMIPLHYAKGELVLKLIQAGADVSIPFPDKLPEDVTLPFSMTSLGKGQSALATFSGDKDLFQKIIILPPVIYHSRIEDILCQDSGLFFTRAVLRQPTPNLNEINFLLEYPKMKELAKNFRYLGLEEPIIKALKDENILRQWREERNKSKTSQQRNSEPKAPASLPRLGPPARAEAPVVERELKEAAAPVETATPARRGRRLSAAPTAHTPERPKRKRSEDLTPSGAAADGEALQSGRRTRFKR
ncbi:MAG: hypothetical protein ACHQJ6_02070 [Candidatus Berkiellales bacterium]